MIAYANANIPSKQKTYYGGKSCLVTIEIFPEDFSLFDKVVFDKNNATYTIKKFKIIQIVDEYLENYTACIFGYENCLYQLNQTVNRTLNCYLTKKRAVNNLFSDNVTYTYDLDGFLLRKKVKNENQNDKYSYTIFKYYKKGIIKENFYSKNLLQIKKIWSKDGTLIRHKIKKNGKWINNLTEQTNK